MSFNVFGNGPVQPANVQFEAIGTVAIPFDSDITLTWPFAYVDSPTVVANLMTVNAASPGLTITLPDATQASTSNLLSSSISVRIRLHWPTIPPLQSSRLSPREPHITFI